MGWRSVLGLIAGVMVGSLVIMGLEMAGHALFHVAEDMTSVETLPLSMQLSVVGFYAVASFLGGLTAAWVGRTRLPAFATGIVLVALGVWNMAMIPHPGWMIAANCAALLFPAIIAGYLTLKRASAAQPSVEEKPSQS